MTPAVPACSVLLPVHNAAATLEACLHSIAAQTYGDYEVIAINDHSTDNSPDILSRYAGTDSRIRVSDAPRRGLVNALNAGLERCRAPLVARMDADDLMRPERLARQVMALRNDALIDVLGSRVALLEGPTTADGFRAYVAWQNQCLEPEQIAHQRYVESPLAHPSVMFRLERIRRAGGYRDGLFPEDYELWLRLLHNGARLAKLPDVLLDWRDAPHRLSRTDPRCARESFDRLRAHWLARDPRILEARDRLVIWGAGRPTRQRCAHLLDQGFGLRAWIDIDAKKIGNVVRGARIHSPAALPDLRDTFVLSYVTNHGAREKIAQVLRQHGRREGEDWLAVG
ncbi:MAG: glycosyltransferase [Gammaproteobacteria bacterium]